MATPTRTSPRSSTSARRRSRVRCGTSSRSSAPTIARRRRSSASSAASSRSNVRFETCDQRVDGAPRRRRQAADHARTSRSPARSQFRNGARRTSALACRRAAPRAGQPPERRGHRPPSNRSMAPVSAYGTPAAFFANPTDAKRLGCESIGGHLRRGRRPEHSHHQKQRRQRRVRLRHPGARSTTAMLDRVDRDADSMRQLRGACALRRPVVFAVLCGIVVEQTQVAFTPDASRDFLNQFVGPMRTLKGRGRKLIAPALVVAWTLLALRSSAFALSPSLEISQYAHYAWTVRDGFSLGNVYAMAQTPDGYLWLGTEFGLFRFDGVRFLPWQPPAGQQLPDKNINSLLATRDGSLWIGTFAGLVILRDGRLVRPPALHDQFVASLFEDGEGTVWAGSLESTNRGGRL